MTGLFIDPEVVGTGLAAGTGFGAFFGTVETSVWDAHPSVTFIEIDEPAELGGHRHAIGYINVQIIDHSLICLIRREKMFLFILPATGSSVDTSWSNMSFSVITVPPCKNDRIILCLI